MDPVDPDQDPQHWGNGTFCLKYCFPSEYLNFLKPIFSEVWSMYFLVKCFYTELVAHTCVWQSNYILTVWEYTKIYIEPYEVSICSTIWLNLRELKAKIPGKLSIQITGKIYNQLFILWGNWSKEEKH